MSIDSIIITQAEFHDVRFPTHLEQHGSDAMHKDPDYSTAYVILHTNLNQFKGYGFSFTLGRGTEVVIKCLEAMQYLIIGRHLNDIITHFGLFHYQLSNEPQLRWLGPQKGVIHLATAALLNAIWDLWARYEAKPVWKLICDMSPEDLVTILDFTYIEDFMTRNEALAILKKNQSTKYIREKYLMTHGYPAYVTSVGWLGYDEDRINMNLKEARSKGFNKFKVKVGQSMEEDIKRLKYIRHLVGEESTLMVDANQIWSVNQSKEQIRRLTECGAGSIYWIEEPTHCDDILGHLEIKKYMETNGIQSKVATGEHCHNAVMFKQYLASGAMDVCQIDSCRLAGPNEVLLVMLMAIHAGVPICPHAGGVGLCEVVQHYSFIDYIIGSCSLDQRLLEFADHLHEHFLVPVAIENGCYKLTMDPGFNTEMYQESISKYEFHPPPATIRGS